MIIRKDTISVTADCFWTLYMKNNIKIQFLLSKN